MILPGVTCPEVPGSVMVFQLCGGLAQLGERQDRTLKVRGSNPLPSTNVFISILISSCDHPVTKRT